MSGNNKALEVKMTKKFVQMLGERDESIRQAFGAMDQKTGGAIGVLEMKIMVVIKALFDMGLTETRLNELFVQVQAEAQQKQAGAQPQPGGDKNEQQPYGKDLTGTCSEPPEEPEGDVGEEQGSEHFG